MSEKQVQSVTFSLCEKTAVALFQQQLAELGQRAQQVRGQLDEAIKQVLTARGLPLNVSLEPMDVANGKYKVVYPPSPPAVKAPAPVVRADDELPATAQ